jgi:nucleotide-binding universal stress UspA family protein
MKILVATDGSENALRAVRYAVDLTARLKEPSVLILANAHHDAGLRGASQFVGKDVVKSYLDDLSQSELAAAVALVRDAHVVHEVRMLRGPAAQVLCEAAATEGCDLIVLGSKGRTALKDLLIGSVAQQVASLAQMPVTLVK